MDQHGGGGGGVGEVREDHVKIFSPVIVHQRDQCDLHPTKQLQPQELMPQTVNRNTLLLTTNQ